LVPISPRYGLYYLPKDIIVKNPYYTKEQVKRMLENSYRTEKLRLIQQVNELTDTLHSVCNNRESLEHNDPEPKAWPEELKKWWIETHTRKVTEQSKKLEFERYILQQEDRKLIKQEQYVLDQLARIRTMFN